LKVKEKIKDNSVLMGVLKRKGLVLFATLGLLVSLLVAGTAAWYTRVSKVTGLTLDVAQYDFNANYTSEEFILNTADYVATAERMCAPGTIGVIPIKVTNQGATAVNYTFAINTSGMAEEFKRRLRFFYFNQSGTEITINEDTAINGTLDAGSGEKEEYIYWEWVYDLNEKTYYDFINRRWVVNGFSTGNGKANTVTTYGRDVYTMAELYTNARGQDILGTVYSSTRAAIDAHDEFDTQVGLQKLNEVFTSAAVSGKTYTMIENISATSIRFNGDETGDPYTYETSVSAIQKAMEATITITGAQANPTAMTTGAVTTGTTKYISISAIHH